jgi:hypothetical protein
MIENGSWRVRLGRAISGFAIMMLIVLGVFSRSTVLAADERKHKGSDDREHSAWDGREHEGSDDQEHEGSKSKVPLAEDWSHRHLVYSGPKTVTHAFSLSRETRYVQQWVRRNAEHHDLGRWRHQEELLNGDWSMFLGNTGTVGADHYPAKFSFNVTTANCATAAQPDFVVYNTSLNPSAAAASASQTATFTATPTAGQTVQISNPNITGGTITLTADNALNSGLFWAVSATLSVDAANLASAIARNSATIGVTATALNATVTATSLNVGTADNTIAWAASVGTPLTINGGGFLAGGANGASIVAFDNLYVGGCTTGAVPSVFWAYNTGGSISNSVTLSGDGSQIAFVQANNGTGLAELVLLKWLASTTATVNSPVTLTAVATAAYRACAAPCMTVIPFAPAATDSNSAPFYDFAQGSDTLYVGNDGGQLLRFTGVFAGTPTQSGAPTWPVNLNTPLTATVTTGPVFDQGAGKAYIADSTGFLYSVLVATGAVIKSGAMAGGLGFVGAPVVDASTGFVYMFTADSNGATLCGGGGLPAVYQVPAAFIAGGTGSKVNVGTCSDFVPMYDGQFDDLYYSSVSGNAGNLYVCGNPGGLPTLYQIPITIAGVMGVPNTGPALATANVACSPVTEVKNPNATGGAKDWIFLSVENFNVTAAQIACPAGAGCIMSFDVTLGAAISGATATAARAAAAGGASGVVVDNTASLAGASQVYFSTLTNGTSPCATSTGTGGCATQASQSALF